MNGYITKEKCGCFAVWVDDAKVSTHGSFDEAEEALIQMYLFQRGLLPPQGGEQ